jgi:hypothetical protein
MLEETKEQSKEIKLKNNPRKSKPEEEERVERVVMIVKTKGNTCSRLRMT